MPALGIFGLVALAVVIALAALAPKAFAAAPPPPFPPTPASAAGPKAPLLTRAQLAEKLRKLGETPAPADLKMGASCYDMAAPSDTADFVCPRDGSRTSYSKNISLAGTVRELPTLRQTAESLPGISASIDDSEFCRQCTPTAPAAPKPILIVKLPDGTEKRTRGVGLRDLDILQEFLTGKLKHQGETGDETPLKDNLPRIRELLGISAQK
jgi:hypothetical protein